MEDQTKDPQSNPEAVASGGSPIEPAKPVASEAVTPTEPVAAQAVTPSDAAPAVDSKMTNNVSGTKSGAVPPAAPQAQQPGAPASAAEPYAVGAAPAPGAQQPGAGAAAPQQPASPYASAQPGAPASLYGSVPPTQPAPSGSGKATGALVCGILAIVLCGAPLIGIVLGIVAIVMGGSYLKTFGQDGKAKAGRICGIVGVVLSILLWVFAIGAMIWAYSTVLNTPTVSSSPSSSLSAPGTSSTDRGSSSSSSSSSSEPVYDENEQTVLDLVSAQFDALEGGEAEMMQKVASIASEGFQEATGVTMEQCGIDPVNYARLMTDDLTYEIDLVVVNDKQGTGWVSADVTCRDIFAVLDLFNEKVDAFDTSGEANAMTEEQVQQKLGELLMAAVTETTTTTEDYATINCTLENGTWVLNEDDWIEELDYLFGLV